MPIDENDKDLGFIPFDEATTPPSGLIEHLKDKWWVVHPSRGLVFVTGWKGSKWKPWAPQCNSSESMVRRWAERFPWAEVRQVPSVFRSINVNDYTN